MDGKQHNALQPFDEAWFDVANSCGKEFELPNISTPINPQWSDNENLVFLEDQQPDILVNNYDLVMTSSSCSGNVVDSFPPLKMVPAITNYVRQSICIKGSDGDINHFPNHLQSVRHSTGITSNVYQPCWSKQKPASQSQIESSNALERRVNSRKNVEPGH
ncbi:hypothetical protein L3X38_024606 [Prunus dulcis]|uniref:Uncharacterized protein n=1 Tax=Prunus dulcis TaxID=3755 RepID=A0AAD4W083_PRUDU|nr:hypothetical protein L3X38_024606 [Prunus dulcis]